MKIEINTETIKSDLSSLSGDYKKTADGFIKIMETARDVIVPAIALGALTARLVKPLFKKR